MVVDRDAWIATLTKEYVWAASTHRRVEAVRVRWATRYESDYDGHADGFIISPFPISEFDANNMLDLEYIDNRYFWSDGCWYVGVCTPQELPEGVWKTWEIIRCAEMM